uniref:Uncharacterized protein n=1 Tax=Amphimedon queenslandica TaxID=400682 RepID=A0A1X7SYQ6_AMPQE
TLDYQYSYHLSIHKIIFLVRVNSLFKYIFKTQNFNSQKFLKITLIYMVLIFQQETIDLIPCWSSPFIL